jgi:hypothetical protein
MVHLHIHCIRITGNTNRKPISNDRGSVAKLKIDLTCGHDAAYAFSSVTPPPMRAHFDKKSRGVTPGQNESKNTASALSRSFQRLEGSSKRQLFEPDPIHTQAIPRTNQESSAFYPYYTFGSQSS